MKYLPLLLCLCLAGCGVSEGVPTGPTRYIPQATAQDPPNVPVPLPQPAPVFPTPAQPPPHAPGSIDLDVMIHEFPGQARVVFGTGWPQGAARWIWVSSDGTVNETNLPQFAKNYIGAGGSFTMEVRIWDGGGTQLASATKDYSVRAKPWDLLVAADQTVTTASAYYVTVRVVNPVEPRADRYRWTFGDGDATNTVDPFIAHPYREKGDYTVTVEALGPEPERLLMGSGTGTATVR